MLTFYISLSFSSTKNTSDEIWRAAKAVTIYIILLSYWFDLTSALIKAISENWHITLTFYSIKHNRVMLSANVFHANEASSSGFQFHQSEGTQISRTLGGTRALTSSMCEKLITVYHLFIWNPVTEMVPVKNLCLSSWSNFFWAPAQREKKMLVYFGSAAFFLFWKWSYKWIGL